MTQNRDFFTPESVDEQIERFSLRLEPGGAPAQTETSHTGDFQAYEGGQDPSAHLVQELQAFYQADYEQNRAFLAHARQRIVARRFPQYDIDQARNLSSSAPVLRFSQERTRKMQFPRSAEQSMGRRLSRGLGLLAAVLVAALLVGTLAVVLTLNHGNQGNQGNQGLGGAKATATSVPTPTPAPTGTILSTHKSPPGTNLGSAAWSPDGKRIAASAVDLKTYKTRFYIWDAASGKNLLTVSLNVESLDWVYWSPAGRYLALANLQTIVIVDSQSGAVVKKISYSSGMAVGAPGANQPWLTSNAPLGSGYGFYSVGWSPDGALLAVAISNFTTGSVVLINPRTGAVKTTFREQARPIAATLAFSSDGKYLAVSYSNDSIVVVWNVATQHAVYVLNGVQASNIAWQPGTHNLARNTSNSVELWDVNAHKLLKTFKGFSAFGWSPDGKELAVYTLSPNPFPPINIHKVIVLDAVTGTQLGSYTTQNTILSAYWSPDGGSIATREYSASSNHIVVWTT